MAADGITRLDIPAGFYALAYNYQGGMVISYRGTDVPISQDVINGWVAGTGAISFPQTKLAADFFKAVIGTDNPNLRTDVEFTGHSLGAGLAGLMASLYGAHTAYIFDNMPFEQAALKISQLTTSLVDIALYNKYYFNGSSPAGVSPQLVFAYATTGEVLALFRGLQLTTVEYHDSYAGFPTFPDNLHSQALLVSLIYADTEQKAERLAADSSGKAYWKNLGSDFYNSLFNNDVAKASGANSILGAKRDKGEFSDILRQTIAYSAIDGATDGTTVFGDTAIRAMFNDATDLGKALALADVSTTLKAASAALSDIFVQFAGQLAMGKVLQTAADAVTQKVLQGVLTLATDQNTLRVDLNNALWTVGKAAAKATDVIVGKNKLLDVLTTPNTKDIITGMNWLWADEFGKKIDNITFPTRDAALTSTIADRTTASTNVSLFVAPGFGDNINGSKDNDFWAMQLTTPLTICSIL